MRTRVALALMIVLAATGARADDCDELARRGFWGLAAFPLEPANALRLGLDEPRGAWIRALAGASPADEAGLYVDDVIVAVDGIAIADHAAFAERAREAVPGQVVTLRVISGRLPATRTLVVGEMPPPVAPDARLSLDAFAGEDGTCRRGLVTRPPDGVDMRGWALVLPDAIGPSMEGGGYNPTRDLALRLAGTGFSTYVFDRPGLGDSQGGGYLDQDLDGEVGDARAALDHLVDQYGVSEVVLFGLGTGGVVAARVAAETAHPAISGVAIASPVGRPYPLYVAEGIARTAAAAGAPATEADRVGQVLRAFYSAVISGRPVDEVLAANPSWAPVVLEGTGRPRGRNAAFIRQVTGTDLQALYASVPVPVVVMLGDADLLSSPADAEVVDGSAAASTLVRLPRTDHLLAFADDAASSMQNLQQGGLFFNPTVADTLVHWLDRRDR